MVCVCVYFSEAGIAQCAHGLDDREIWFDSPQDTDFSARKF